MQRHKISDWTINNQILETREEGENPPSETYTNGFTKNLHNKPGQRTLSQFLKRFPKSASTEA
jgi:hypothetical protein